MLRLLILLWIAIPAAASAQPALKNLDPPEYFDFWVGEWNVEWKEKDGATGHGTNKIEKILNGKVLLENFEALSGQMRGFRGKSYSVYDSRAGEWKQTWVDNQGSYLDFVGEKEGEQRIFAREGTDRDGNTVLQRMVFYDIKQDSFTWDWETSSDGGQTWELRWRIRYTRL